MTVPTKPTTMTKPNFTIKPGCTVWLHNRAWRAGNEAALQKAGFNTEQKLEQAKRGMIGLNPTPARSRKKTATTTPSKKTQAAASSTKK